MSRRCVVCGDEQRVLSEFCKHHGKLWDKSREGRRGDFRCFIARQFRAIERRRYRELLRAAERVCRESPPGWIASASAMDALRDAVRNAKARRSR